MPLSWASKKKVSSNPSSKSTSTHPTATSCPTSKKYSTRPTKPTKGNSKIEREAGQVYTSTKTETSTSASGSRTSTTGKASISIKMGRGIRDKCIKVTNMDKEFTTFLMEKYIKVPGSITRFKDSEQKKDKFFIRESGKKVSGMEKDI